MYRLKEIEEKLFHVVGWRQSYNPDDAINESLTETESGLFFQEAHPLLTIENVKSAMPEQFIFVYPEWNMMLNYQVGSKVRHNGIVFIAVQENTDKEPLPSDFNDDFDDDFVSVWAVYNFLSDFLEQETKSGIKKAITQFATIKKLDRETKNLLERRTFFDGAGRLAATVNNHDRLVGYEITPVRSMGVTAKIEKIGLQMTGGTGEVKLYVFHSNSVDPYRTITVNYTLQNGGFQWFPITDLYLPYISDDTNSGGSWFLVYNQAELPPGMEAITVSKDWSRDPCGGCNIGSVQTWRELTKYLMISPFMYKAPEDFADFPEMWDISKNMYTNTVNYGINVEITVGCDLTDFIVSQRSIFADVIQKQVAANLLRTIAMNPDVRVNRNQSNVSRMEILYELDGNTSSDRPGGLGYDLEKAYKALKVDTQGLDRICLTCNNHGVKYRTV